jgi:hypothetical protein
VCRQFPHLATLVIGRSASTPGLWRVRERMLGVLLDAGFEPRAALQALGMLAYYTTGFAGGQASFNASGAETTLPNLPPEEFPHLTALAHSYHEHASAEAFELGLEHILAGLHRQLTGR